MRFSRLASIALIPGLLLAVAPVALAQDKPLRDGAVPHADRDDKPNLPEAPPPRSAPVTLDRLFERLAAAKTPEEAKGIANLIQRRWARSGSDTADLLMTRAQDALKARELPLAIELLD